MVDRTQVFGLVKNWTQRSEEVVAATTTSQSKTLSLSSAQIRIFLIFTSLRLISVSAEDGYQVYCSISTHDLGGVCLVRLKYAILYVNNVADTLAFYEHAFGLERKMLHESGDYGELDTGTTSLSFSSLKLMADLGKSPVKADHRTPCFEIAFETDDVKAALKRAIGAGAVLVQDVRDEPWGQTTAYVADANGFLIEICSPLRTEEQQ